MAIAHDSVNSCSSGHFSSQLHTCELPEGLCSTVFHCEAGKLHCCLSGLSQRGDVVMLYLFTSGWCLCNLQNQSKPGPSLSPQSTHHRQCPIAACPAVDSIPVGVETIDRHLGNFSMELACAFRTCSGQFILILLLLQNHFRWQRFSRSVSFTGQELTE